MNYCKNCWTTFEATGTVECPKCGSAAPYKADGSFEELMAEIRTEVKAEETSRDTMRRLARGEVK